MIATIINCIAVIVGSIIGLLLGGRVSEKYKLLIFDGAGITSLVIGVSMAMATQQILFLAFALIAGGLLGTAVDIDGAILRFGSFLERLTMRRKLRNTINSPVGPSAAVPAHQSGWDFGHAFLNSSVLFCVGAMALLGAFKAGTEGDYTLILTKSVLDGFMAILMAAAMGPGVAFSALPILVYQGLLTLGSGFLKPYVSDHMLSELTGTGGAMVLMIGLNLLAIKKIKTANFLPALVFIVVFVLLAPYIEELASGLGF